MFPVPATPWLMGVHCAPPGRRLPTRLSVKGAISLCGKRPGYMNKGIGLLQAELKLVYYWAPFEVLWGRGGERKEREREEEWQKKRGPGAECPGFPPVLCFIWSLWVYRNGSREGYVQRQTVFTETIQRKLFSTCLVVLSLITQWSFCYSDVSGEGIVLPVLLVNTSICDLRVSLTKINSLFYDGKYSVHTVPSESIQTPWLFPHCYVTALF